MNDDLGTSYLRFERRGPVGWAAFVEKRSPEWVPEEFRGPGRL